MSWCKRQSPLLATVMALVVVICSGMAAQTTQNKAVGGNASNDEEFARLVKEWTTRPDFISPLVDHLPKVPGIPSPKHVLGHHISEPETLTYYTVLLTYPSSLA